MCLGESQMPSVFGSSEALRYKSGQVFSDPKLHYWSDVEVVTDCWSKQDSFSSFFGDAGCGVCGRIARTKYAPEATLSPTPSLAFVLTRTKKKGKDLIVNNLLALNFSSHILNNQQSNFDLQTHYLQVLASKYIDLPPRNKGNNNGRLETANRRPEFHTRGDFQLSRIPICSRPISRPLRRRPLFSNLSRVAADMGSFHTMALPTWYILSIC
jgi:hypothetical protein